MTREEFDNLKKGDIIRCVDPACASLTHGKEYTVLDKLCDSCGEFIRIANDMAIKFCYYRSRFEVEPAQSTAIGEKPISIRIIKDCDCGALVCNTTHAHWCSVNLRND